MPDHFVNILIRLHTGAKMKLKMGSTELNIDCNIGVRQGSCEGPILFSFMMQAVMESTRWESQEDFYRPIDDLVFHYAVGLNARTHGENIARTPMRLHYLHGACGMHHRKGGVVSHNAHAAVDIQHAATTTVTVLPHG